MLLDQIHPEDIKAIIRKRFGTVAKFVETHALPVTGVSDHFRGRTSRPVRDALERVLQDEAQSINLDDSAAGQNLHRLNDGAR